MISEPFPPHLTPEVMTKHFLAFTEENYPSAEKALQMVSKMGIKSVKGQIIVLSLMRDAVRQMAPRLYRSVQHRDDVFMAIIEALEDLEEELEELEEEMAAEIEEQNEEEEEEEEDKS